MIDPVSGEAMPFMAHLDRLLTLIAEDADALGCTAEVEAARIIANKGTSSDMQAKVFAEARKHPTGEREALRSVVDWLADTTASGA